MIPLIDSTKTTAGLLFSPGTMVGTLLAGASHQLDALGSLGEVLAVRLHVAEGERIGRHQVGIPGLEAARVDDEGYALTPASDRVSRLGHASRPLPAGALSRAARRVRPAAAS
jgi:hypothetical protein